jgi:anaerobic selenocysteine-containing dehydrogenase
VQLRRRLVEPVGEARDDFLVFAELAGRLGYGDRWPGTAVEKIEAGLRGTGLTYETLAASEGPVALPAVEQRYRKWETGELRGGGTPGFNTPTGKLELASEWLRSHGHEPLPRYTEPREGPIAAPGLARRFPLVFSSGARTQTEFRSQHRNVPSLTALSPVPLLHLHADDAAARGIDDGDPVDVVTTRGRVPFVARVGHDIVRGAVEANMGGGGPLGPEAWRLANVNELTDPDRYDPISGFPVVKALLCDVVPRITG